jgi:hypothetical protein
LILKSRLNSIIICKYFTYTARLTRGVGLVKQARRARKTELRAAHRRGEQLSVDSDDVDLNESDE